MSSHRIPLLLAAALLAVGSLVHAPAYSATATLSQDEINDLLFMREEEKLARDTYLTFYELYDNLTVFSNIASAEQKHMDAILRLLKKYGLPDPAAGNEIGEFTNTTLQALYDDTLIPLGEASGLGALKVGGLIEEKDMKDINAAIERSQQDDIDAVYATLLCGSRNHLRAFAENIETVTGVPYVAQLLTQAEVDAILATPMEKCNKSSADGNAVNTCRGKCLGWMK